MTMRIETKRLRLGFSLWLLCCCAASGSQAEQIDANEPALEFDRFCYPATQRNTRNSCECSNVDAAPWGMRALHIDCSYKNYNKEQLSELLPLYIDSLDASWNSLLAVPHFASDSLRQLNLMHNNISSLMENNFGGLRSLHELYLGWNSIQQLHALSFANLPHLQVLQLSHNNLHVLPAQLFAPLLVLQALDLSWNRQLNQSLSGSQLYSSYGLQQALQTLRLDACNLQQLELPHNLPLRELSLRRNQLERLPQQLPAQLQRLDCSENQLTQLLPVDTKQLQQLQQLYLEDMPQLQSIAAQALAPLQQLQQLSFQNSRRLSSIDPEAFQLATPNSHFNSSLRLLSFRGTLLRSFNASLAPVFGQLTQLDLNGVPLHCDCELAWLKDFPLNQTNGRCLRPARVRGILLSALRRDDFNCNRWPRWAYGLIILSLIALCAAGVYLIVMGLRPHRGVTMRRKVGSGSPYARVTIEPNRQEHFTS
ncbi:CG4781 [Drosophila busckii]|uniref:CG4781 n=1 Tax=Drosophila busckii TaxID=30019 RepID=A0A0M4ED47_DROBS|nr:slit homolog 1 protein [Drosophila busckii]ALC40826.1 CG4781 [Drosophila busckii]